MVYKSDKIDILLISPANEKLGKFYRFVPRSVPIALGLLASYVIKFGYNPEIFDEEIASLNKESLKEIMDKMQTPRLFAISCMTTNAKKTYNIAKMIKELDGNAIITVGGIHPTVEPEEALNTGYIDCVVRGEGEKALLEFLNRARKGDIGFEDTKNTVYKDKQGKIIYNEIEKESFDINELPIFPYHLFNRDKYDLGFILSSRGCPFNCIFCSQRAITKGKYRPRNNELVIKELEYLINEENQKNITFFDDFFIGDKNRVRELCKIIREKGLHKKCSFGVQTRADSVDEEILKEMKISGFDSLMFGFETSSNRLMQVINKRETVEDNINAIKLAKALGYTVEATFIFGFPEETYEDRIKALQIAKTIGIDRARFNLATPYPGTEFYRMAIAENKIQKEAHWENFSSTGALTSKIFEAYKVPYCPDGTNSKDLTGEVLLANLLFYINARNLKKLFNPDKKGSGKWFELSKSKIFDIKIMFDLSALFLDVVFRTIYYVITSKECRKFVIQGILYKS